jgi:hypothetical protein
MAGGMLFALPVFIYRVKNTEMDEEDIAVNEDTDHPGQSVIKDIGDLEKSQ